MLSRRQFFAGSLSAIGLTALPLKARGVTSYKRGVTITTTYVAKSPLAMLSATPTLPGYHPTLASVYAQLLQPGASPPPSTNPFTAAYELVQRPWFNGLGSPDPLGHPPKTKLIRQTKFSWLNTTTTGFVPVSPVKRILLAKDLASERQYFRDRPKIQTKRICKAMLLRLPSNLNSEDELAQGIRSLIKRKCLIEQLPTLAGTGFYREELEPTLPEPTTVFGVTVSQGDTFPDLINPAPATITHTGIELLAASAAFAEAAAIMGIGASALAQAATEAIGISTFGFLSATGLSILLTFSAVVAATAAVVIFYAVVTAKPRGDGTWDFFTGFAPFGISGRGSCNCTDQGAITLDLSYVTANLGLNLTIPDDGAIAPIGNTTSDDGGAAPSAGVAGDTGDGGDF